ncbi:hypothetical protein RMSM_04051 [Rhodopirellula maiorica SM1]|uniref:Uncharacterized protein n=1 Tax=Rhodopirellula maiorica SM1 TaxID=1265738 RepID=M5RI89_9BACT|nr:hypothetical protein RMSM_04051 [Rhodopirellula maiorica SM1]
MDANAGGFPSISRFGASHGSDIQPELAITRPTEFYAMIPSYPGWLLVWQENQWQND